MRKYFYTAPVWDCYVDSDAPDCKYTILEVKDWKNGIPIKRTIGTFLREDDALFCLQTPVYYKALCDVMELLCRNDVCDPITEVSKIVRVALNPDDKDTPFDE